MRIGILGGAFDPIHLGHLAAAQAAYEQAGLDEVWFMPSFIPPLKNNPPLFTVEQRFAMTEAATASTPYFKVSDVEIRRGVTSYTIDTVNQLLQLHPNDSFQWIIGADRLNDLLQWKDIDQVVEHISFLGLARPGYPIGIKDYPAAIKARIQLVNMPEMAISSTEIRNRIVHGISVKGLVPELILTQIER
jgi:nicotinate-nucleotide adenylyltransferase